MHDWFSYKNMKDVSCLRLVTRHTIKSRHEISVNFGPVKECVSRREINKIRREKQQNSAFISHTLIIFYKNTFISTRGSENFSD